MPQNIDLCFAWTWEYDRDLSQLLDIGCQNHHHSFLSVTPENVETVNHDILSGDLNFKMVYDRASDEDHQFLPLVNWAKDHNVLLINNPEISIRSSDKMTMHHALINTGLQTPYTIFIPTYVEQPEIQPFELGALKGKFIIKPAHGSGGEGVKIEADSWNTVLEARRENPDDIYLLQVNVKPGTMKGKSSWFRVFYCFGQVYSCWWGPKSHTYEAVTSDEEKDLDLGQLKNIASKIAQISSLALFSTEIAVTEDRVFIVVDYVNDQIDLRLQSKYPDGVPDEVVKTVAENIVSHIPDMNS